jgi:tetratricopeptide (TPR) repeat protein
MGVNLLTVRNAMAILGVCLAIAVPGVAAHADIVYLKSGGKIEGKVTDIGDSVEITLKRGGKALVKKADIDHIEPKPFEVEPPAPKPKDPVADPATGLKGGPLLGETCVDFYNQVAMRIPRTWRIVKTSQQSLLTAAERENRAYAARIEIAVIQNRPATGGGGENADQTGWASAYRTQFLKLFEDYKESVPETECVIAGCKALKFGGSFTSGDFRIQHLDVAFTRDGNLYVLGFRSEKDAYAGWEAAVEASFETFRFVVGPAVTSAQKEQFGKDFKAGQDFLAKNMMDDAVAAFKRAEEVMPTHPEVHTCLAAIFTRTNQVDKALSEYDRLMKLKPDWADMYYCVGMLYQRKNMPEESMQNFLKAVELDPDNLECQIAIGAVYSAKGELQRAMDCFRKACEIAPNSPVAHYNLGEIYAALNRRGDAEKEYKRALEIDPAHENAKKAIERLKSKK